MYVAVQPGVTVGTESSTIETLPKTTTVILQTGICVSQVSNSRLFIPVLTCNNYQGRIQEN